MKDTYTKEEVIAMLEDVYAKTAGSYNDYGNNEYDYQTAAVVAIKKYIETGDI